MRYIFEYKIFYKLKVYKRRIKVFVRKKKEKSNYENEKYEIF